MQDFEKSERGTQHFALKFMVNFKDRFQIPTEFQFKYSKMTCRMKNKCDWISMSTTTITEHGC
jgi:hypothetical protein